MHRHGGSVSWRPLPSFSPGLPTLPRRKKGGRKALGETTERDAGRQKCAPRQFDSRNASRAAVVRCRSLHCGPARWRHAPRLPLVLLRLRPLPHARPHRTGNQPLRLQRPHQQQRLHRRVVVADFTGAAGALARSAIGIGVGAVWGTAGGRIGAAAGGGRGEDAKANFLVGAVGGLGYLST